MLEVTELAERAEALELEVFEPAATTAAEEIARLGLEEFEPVPATEDDPGSGRGWLQGHDAWVPVAGGRGWFSYKLVLGKWRPNAYTRFSDVFLRQVPPEMWEAREENARTVEALADKYQVGPRQDLEVTIRRLGDAVLAKIAGTSPSQEPELTAEDHAIMADIRALVVLGYGLVWPDEVVATSLAQHVPLGTMPKGGGGLSVTPAASVIDEPTATATTSEED